MKVLLTNVRLAFPQIFNPKAVNEGDKPAYSALLIIDPEKQKGLIDNLKKAIQEVAKGKWGAKADTVLKAITSKGNLCLRDGADKADYEGFDGMMYVSSRGYTRPLVIDVDKSPLTEDDGKPYSGCYANVSVELWPQDNQYGKRVNAQLRGVQFVKDGEAFAGGGGSASVDEFDELEATDADTDDIFG
jgi:hypothetical protein